MPNDGKERIMKTHATGRLVAATLVALLAMAPTVALAEGPRVRLGTLVPKGSSYFRHLQEMGEKWRQAPAGGASLTIYPDGAMGGEAEMVRRIRVGQIQAGLLTAVGLSTIEPAVAGLQTMPMMFRSLEEVDFVGAELQPDLEKSLRDKGFVVLGWVDAGWVRFFSKREVVRPADLQPLKLFTWAGDARAFDLYRSAGFNPVALETADIIPGLQTGLIEAVPMPPFVALTSQVDIAAPHMLELNWAPLAGALVVASKTWDGLPPATQDAMMVAAREACARIKADSRREALESVTAMQGRGLKVHTVTPEVEAEWRAVVASTYPKLRGSLVPDEIFDRVVRLLETRRKTATGAGK
jgi:TRAP-type transport system periplasmic protein